MTHEEVWEILQKISYKPGWSFDFEESSFRTITVAATVKNSRDNPLWEELTMRMSVPFDPRMTKKEFLFQVMRIVAEIELHEVQEFFRYDGKVIFDPHTIPYVPAPLRIERSHAFDVESVEL